LNVLALADKMGAILRRDLLTAVRYRTGFLLAAFGAVAELAAFYYLSRAVGPGFRPEGLDYFPFLLVGTGFYTFLVMGVNAFLTAVQEAQQAGTLEVLMTTSTSPAILVSLSALSAFAGSTLNLFFYIVVGLALFGAPVHPNLAGCLVVFTLSMAIAISLGILSAALQIAVQKGSAVIWLLGSAVWLFTGTMFPVTALPKVLRNFSDLIPITHSLNAMRMALLQNASLSVLAHDVAVLGLSSLLLLPLSLVVFSWTLRRARLRGSLSFC
jgi:ABC-2 type transport system permease protein